MQRTAHACNFITWCHLYAIQTGYKFGPGPVGGCGNLFENLFEAECTLLFTSVCIVCVCICACDFCVPWVLVSGYWVCEFPRIASFALFYLSATALYMGMCMLMRMFMVHVRVCKRTCVYGFAIVDSPACCSRLALIHFYWVNLAAGCYLHLFLGQYCLQTTFIAQCLSLIP